MPTTRSIRLPASVTTGFFRVLEGVQRDDKFYLAQNANVTTDLANVTRNITHTSFANVTTNFSQCDED